MSREATAANTNGRFTNALLSKRRTSRSRHVLREDFSRVLTPGKRSLRVGGGAGAEAFGERFVVEETDDCVAERFRVFRRHEQARNLVLDDVLHRADAARDDRRSERL